MKDENTERPVHPGKIVKEMLIDELKLSYDEASLKLGIHKSSFSRLINGTHRISKKIAKKLGEFGFLGKDEAYWIKLNKDYKESIKEAYNG